MSLKVSSRITYGNATAVNIIGDTDLPEIIFTVAPHGHAEALWFCFEVIETEPEKVTASRIKITLKYVRNLAGCNEIQELKPVYQPKGQQWFRMKSGHANIASDGQISASWTIPYPAPSTTIAFCYPYGRTELATMMQKSKGYWHQDSIGVSQHGRNIIRLSNNYGKTGGNQLGIYIIARQNAGETPGTWVLDGMLQQFSRNKKHNFIIWAIPLADIDQIIKGDYNKYSANNLINSWGDNPTRYETVLFQNDIKEWNQRCKPYLIIDLQSPGGSDTDGIYSLLPDPEQFAEANKETVAWANVFKETLKSDYAADDFKRVTPTTNRMLSDFARKEINCTAITLNIPYASCKKNIMQQKQYRDAGKRIADAILHRNHKNSNK